MRQLTPFKIKILSLGLTQKEVARRTKIAQGTLSQIATAQYVPDNQQKQKLAKALNCTVPELFIQ